MAGVVFCGAGMVLCVAGVVFCGKRGILCGRRCILCGTRGIRCGGPAIPYGRRCILCGSVASGVAASPHKYKGLKLVGPLSFNLELWPYIYICMYMYVFAFVNSQFTRARCLRHRGKFVRVSAKALGEALQIAQPRGPRWNLETQLQEL